MHVYVSVCVYTLFYKIKKSTKIQIIIRFKFGSKNKKIGFMSNHLYMPSIFFMRVICEDMKEIDIYFYESNVRRYEKDRFLGYHNLN